MTDALRWETVDALDGLEPCEGCGVWFPLSALTANVVDDLSYCAVCWDRMPRASADEITEAGLDTTDTEATDD